jgi:hypothetical protein
MITVALPSLGGNSTTPSQEHFLPAWLTVTLEGNYFTARLVLRALQDNILQLFTKNTRRFLKDFRWNPVSPGYKPDRDEKRKGIVT